MKIEAPGGIEEDDIYQRDNEPKTGIAKSEYQPASTGHEKKREIISSKARTSAGKAKSAEENHLWRENRKASRISWRRRAIIMARRAKKMAIETETHHHEKRRKEEGRRNAANENGGEEKSSYEISSGENKRKLGDNGYGVSASDHLEKCWRRKRQRKAGKKIKALRVRENWWRRNRRRISRGRRQEKPVWRDETIRHRRKRQANQRHQYTSTA